MRFVLLSVMLCAAGCATVTPEPEVAMSEVVGAITRENMQVPQSMRLSTKIDYVDGKNNKRVVGQDLVLSAREPQNMRITISAFDKAISTLVTDGRVFALMDVSQNVYLAGFANAENISQILPVSLAASDLFRVIHGGFPVDGLVENAEESQEIVWDGKAGGYRRDLRTKDGGIQSVYYAYPTWDIFKITVVVQDKQTYSYEASDFKTYQQNGMAYRYPKQIIFRLPQEDTNVRLRVEKCELNVEFSDAVFTLIPTNGAKILIMDDLRAAMEEESAQEDSAEDNDVSEQSQEEQTETIENGAIPQENVTISEEENGNIPQE